MAVCGELSRDINSTLQERRGYLTKTAAIFLPLSEDSN
jgi:hypothetical protein